MRKSLPWLLSIFLILIVLMLIGSSMLNRWLAGEGFHTLLEQKSSEALHAKTSFGPLQWGWFELSSPHFNANRQDETTSLRSMEAGGLRGRLDPSSLLQGLWRISEISLDHASVHIDSARHPKDPNLSVHQKLPSSSASSLPSWIPSMLVIDLIRSQTTDILIELPSGMSIDLQGTHLEARPEGSETRFEARDGVLKTPFFPNMEIKSVHCRIKPDLVDLTGADLNFPMGGTLQLEGSFPDTKESFLTGHWDQVPVATLLPALSKQILGTLDGSGTVSWDLTGLSSISGNVSANKVILTGVPMLDGVARLTRMDAFHHLFLQQAHASFSVKGGNTTWHDVTLESQGLIKLVGDAETKKNGAFSGIFQLGLSSPIVSAIPGASQVFSKDQHDGYFWTSLQVGGSLDHLTEDLTPRVTAAVLSNAGLLLQEGVKQGLQILGLPGGALPTNTNSPSGSTPPPPAPSSPVDDLKKSGGAVMDVLGGFLK